ncbi:MAG TPA: hypothetical protein VFB54_08890 [Burkholderiales bacterium]|nr:hypothetical protein [Burkholderiales bacterium]
MKALLAILVVLNLSLLAYAVFEPTGPSSDSPLAHQIQAEQIRVIPPPPPSAQRTAACLQWGTFADAELDPVRRELIAALPPGRWSEARIPVVARWWVFIPPARERADAERKVRELVVLGVRDYVLIDAEGPWRNAISLGVFRSEDAATSFVERLRAKGVRSARIGNRDHRLIQTAVVLREPDAQVSARMAELALRFPGTELRAGACPATVATQ